MASSLRARSLLLSLGKATVYEFNCNRSRQSYLPPPPPPNFNTIVILYRYMIQNRPINPTDIINSGWIVVTAVLSATIPKTTECQYQLEIVNAALLMIIGWSIRYRFSPIVKMSIICNLEPNTDFCSNTHTSVVQAGVQTCPSACSRMASTRVGVQETTHMLLLNQITLVLG